jgi:mRNA interferase MazF
MEENNAKKFEKWFICKPKIESKSILARTFFKEGQIWWCSLGVNVGIEIDGKNNDFERPVLVFQIFNSFHLLVIPISSESRNDRFHISVNIFDKKPTVILSQIRAVSSKRLLRKLTQLTPEEFKMIRNRIKDML